MYSILAYVHKLAVVCLACALLPLSACTDRTGVLLQVTREDATTPPDIDELRFFVGTQVDPERALAGDFVDEGDPAESVNVAEGRDLLTDPYRLLLNKGDTDDITLMLAVVAYKGGEMVAFGGLDQSIRFIDGKVVQWDIVVKGEWPDDIKVTDCLVWTTEDGTIVIGSLNDKDCDGDPATDDCDDEDPTVGHTQPEICDGKDNDCNGVCDDGPLDFDEDNYTICSNKILPDGTCSDFNDSHFDCDDEDPLVHPGATETCDGKDNNCNEVCDEGFDPDHDFYTECGSIVSLCDGTNSEDIDCEPEEENAFPGNEPEYCDGLDNDCDGNFYPAKVFCYVLITEEEPQCWLGRRSCGDAEGQGWIGECVPITEPGEVVPMALCEAYNACSDAADPYACANDLVADLVYSCTIYYPAAGEPGEVCLPAAAMLPNSADMDDFCLWAVAPATAYPPNYDVGLSEYYLNGTDIIIEMCDPYFVVNGMYEPKPESFIVYQSVNSAHAQLFKINLTPMMVVDCPMNGLQCPGFPDVMFN